METELLEAVRAYLCGKLDRTGLQCEVAGFDWSDKSSSAMALRPIVGMLELLLEEVGEGFREEAELRQRAQELAQ
ncbi:MAG: hypothetical protein ACR2PL_21200 [Dehalococcoidia bacterium]